MHATILNRRGLLAGMGATALAGCAPRRAGLAAIPAAAPFPALAPIDLRAERITHITVCLRPFRAAGPRMDVEQVAGKRVVHNYGHGGSGWSLAWGSAAIATASAMAGGTRDVAVIGCGAMGLTTAILLQQAGARVTIYARERVAESRSARATGTWSPASRVADAAHMGADFPARWEQMARASWARHLSYVGLPGEPVLWREQYLLFDAPGTGQAAALAEPAVPPIAFAHFPGVLRGLAPRARPLDPHEHPFAVARALRAPTLTFNIAALADRLTRDFLMEGGRIVPMVLHSPADLALLPQPVVVNCTGYGARALWQDDTIVPVRGQIAWLPPEPRADYALFYRNVTLLPRPDGIVVQQVGASEMFGVGESNETPDRAEADTAIATLAPLFAAIRQA